MKKEYISIQPEYVKKFQCDGSLCDAMCCQNWKIVIDKHTYKKYKKISNKTSREKILSTIKRNKEDGTYQIKLDSAGKCPNICDDNLCFIQRTLGEPYLSEVCASYPRVVRKINGFIEQSLNLSCPLATELALLKEEPMGFEQISLSLKANSKIHDQLNTQELAADYPLFNFFTELQMFTIEVLQNRKYTMNERLIILGLFLDKVEELRLKNEFEQIPTLIELYKTYITTNEISKFLVSIEPNLSEKMKLMLELIDHLCKSDLTKEMIPYTDMIMQMFNLKSETYTRVLIEKYQENNIYYQQFLNKYSYILENFFVNDVFQNTFPFIFSKSISKNYIIFIALFSIMNFFFLNLAAYHKKDLSISHVMEFIQLFSRKNSSKHYIDGLTKVLDAKDKDVLYFISAFLK